MVARVEMPVETDRSDPARGGSLLHVELLGAMAIRRPDGSDVALPAFAQGARAAGLPVPCPAGRAACPACASCCGTCPTIRAANCAGACARSAALIDERAGTRVDRRRRHRPARSLRLPRRCRSRSRARRAAGHPEVGAERQQALCRAVRGRIARRPRDRRAAPLFNAWITGAAPPLPRHPDRAAREPRARRCHGRRAVGYLEKWLKLAPFDPRAHETAARPRSARRGRIRRRRSAPGGDGKLFEADGLDSAPIRDDLAAQSRRKQKRLRRRRRRRCLEP